MNRLTVISKILLIIAILLLAVICVWLYKSTYILKSNQRLYDINQHKFVTTTGRFYLLDCIKFNNIKKVCSSNCDTFILTFQNKQGVIYNTKIAIKGICKQELFVNYNNVIDYIINNYQINQAINNYFGKISNEQLYQSRDQHRQFIKNCIIKNSDNKLFELKDLYLVDIFIKK